MTRLFQTLLSREVLSLAFMLAVLLARLLLRNMPKRLSIFLWAVVLIRLLCPLTWTSPVSLVPEAVSQVSSAVKAQPLSGEASVPASGAPAPQRDWDVSRADTPLPRRALFWKASSLVWLLGAGFLLAFELQKLLRLRKTLRGAQQTEPGVFVCRHLKSAFLLGVFRPVIYLPAELSAQERRYVLLHEKTHIKRLDHIWKLLALLCLCIHWFDPVVWLCFALFGQDLELACDEASTAQLTRAERCDYAQTLLRLSSGVLLSPLPAFSAPRPERRIRRILNWKKPSGIVCAAALFFVLLLAAGLIVNPVAREALFARQYLVSGCLYDAPQYDFTYSQDAYPSFALSGSHMLYIREKDASFNECGGLREIPLSEQALLSLFDDGFLSEEARRKLLRAKTFYLAERSDASFYLVLQSGNEVLLAAGYNWGSDAALVRWLFALTPDQSQVPIEALTAQIGQSISLSERESIQIYSIYASEKCPGLLFAAYDGAKNGVAVFFYSAASSGYKTRMLTTSDKQEAFYCKTASWYDLEKSFSIITSHREDLAEVRAVWDGVELTAPVTTCPAMVVLEWPEELSSHEDTSPDIRFYDAVGTEIPRE